MLTRSPTSPAEMEPQNMTEPPVFYRLLQTLTAGSLSEHIVNGLNQNSYIWIHHSITPVAPDFQSRSHVIGMINGLFANGPPRVTLISEQKT